MPSAQGEMLVLFKTETDQLILYRRRFVLFQLIADCCCSMSGGYANNMKQKLIGYALHLDS